MAPNLSKNSGFNPFKLAGIAVIALIIFMAILSSFVTIGPGERGVLMTFGAVHQGVLTPGLHMKIPFVQSVKRMNVRIQKSETSETAASHDLQDVTTKVAVNWSINPADAEWVYQNLGNEELLQEKVIGPIVSNAVKAVAAHYDAEQLVEQRDTVRDQVQQQVVTGLGAYKIRVQGVNITNFQFSPEYSTAIEQKQVAQQKALQAQYDLQRAEVQAKQAVAVAKGQADSQRLLQQTLTPQILENKWIDKWDGRQPQVVNGAGSGLMVGPLNLQSASTEGSK